MNNRIFFSSLLGVFYFGSKWIFNSLIILGLPTNSANYWVDSAAKGVILASIISQARPINNLLNFRKNKRKEIDLLFTLSELTLYFVAAVVLVTTGVMTVDVLLIALSTFSWLWMSAVSKMGTSLKEELFIIGILVLVYVLGSLSIYFTSYKELTIRLVYLISIIVPTVFIIAGKKIAISRLNFQYFSDRDLMAFQEILGVLQFNGIILILGYLNRPQDVILFRTLMLELLPLSFLTTSLVQWGVLSHRKDVIEVGAKKIFALLFVIIIYHIIFQRLFFGYNEFNVEDVLIIFILLLRVVYPILEKDIIRYGMHLKRLIAYFVSILPYFLSLYTNLYVFTLLLVMINMLILSILFYEKNLHRNGAISL